MLLNKEWRYNVEKARNVLFIVFVGTCIGSEKLGLQDHDRASKLWYNKVIIQFSIGEIFNAKS